MSRLRIRERIARKTRVLVLLHCRNMFEVPSDMWLVYHMSSDTCLTLKSCSNSISKKGRHVLNVRVFELYKYTSTIFDSFALSLPNQAARHVDWRRKQ